MTDVGGRVALLEQRLRRHCRVEAPSEVLELSQQNIRRLAQAVAVLTAAILIGVFPGVAHATVSYGSEEIALVRLLNEYRVSNGVDPVLSVGHPLRVVHKHSLDMAKYGFFSHTTVASDWFHPGRPPAAA